MQDLTPDWGSLVDLAVIAHAVEGFLLFAMVFGSGLGVQNGIERLLAIKACADELVEFVAGGGRQAVLDAIQVAARAVRLVVFQQKRSGVGSCNPTFPIADFFVYCATFDGRCMRKEMYDCKT